MIHRIVLVPKSINGVNDDDNDNVGSRQDGKDVYG